MERLRQGTHYSTEEGFRGRTPRNSIATAAARSQGEEAGPLLLAEGLLQPEMCPGARN
jgi:hypothetical protein